MNPTSVRAPAKRAGSVVQALAELRDEALVDSSAAQAHAWDWITSLGRSGRNHELRELWSLGTVPHDLDGPTEGVLLNPALQRLPSPWQGKGFDRAAGVGANEFHRWARPILAVGAPLFPFTQGPRGLVGLSYALSITASVRLHESEVLLVDYGNQDVNNPRFGILSIFRRFYDEITEIVPGVFLGRGMIRVPYGRFVDVGYFALRQPALSVIAPSAPAIRLPRSTR